MSKLSIPSSLAAKPLPTRWKPHQYQLDAVARLVRDSAVGLFLSPGLGKTSITLQAIAELIAAKKIRKVLVVSPLRPATTTWPSELRKWSQFTHLRFEVLHGPKKLEAWNRDADIYIINPEGLAWLLSLKTLPGFKPKPDPKQLLRRGIDCLVVDELTKFKHANTSRFKLLKPLLPFFKRRYGLTGSPTANGLMDLFGEMYVLDLGASLGRYITWYRKKYFVQAWNGFGWDLQPGAADKIYAAIAPSVLQLSADDYLQLPPIIDDVRLVTLPPKARATYDELETELVTSLSTGELVVAANTGVALGKCRQLASGALYSAKLVNGRRTWADVHDAKLDALNELVEELQGEPLLVAYDFQHDLARIRSRLGDVPFIGSGVTAAQTTRIIDEWNRGKISVLLVHPQSGALGINLQGAGGHICWFTPTWNYELYAQLIDRLHRQGSTQQRIINHVLLAEDTVDDRVVWRLIKGKARGEAALASALTELAADRANCKQL